MTDKCLISRRLSLLFSASVLSTGLLLSGCSNADDTQTDETATAVNNEAAAVTETATETPTEDTPDMANNAAQDDSNTVVAADSSDVNEDIREVMNPVTASSTQSSLLTNPDTQSGTPEDAVKQALDHLYYGDVKQAAQYYQVDMANFEQELAKTQSAFQQTVDSVTITDTTYNDDRTRATITGELQLKDQQAPAPLTYELQKINGAWKILG